MKRKTLLLVLFPVLFISSCHKEDNQYGGNEVQSKELVISGRLSESITDENILNITKLIVNDTISGEDWNILSRMVRQGKLEVLDMRNAHIVGVEGTDNRKDDAIPAYIFSRNKTIKEVYLPNTLKVIGEEAFSDCLKLETVHFPTTIDSIAPHAFDGAHLSGELNIPSHLRIIGRQAFARTKINKVIINSDVLTTKHGSIYAVGGNSVFADCKELTEVVVKEGCTILELGFQQCTSLTNVSLPQSLRHIGSLSETTGNYIFYYCSALNTIKLPDSLMSIGYSAFSRTSLKSLKLPNCVQTLKTFAFNNCAFLETVELSDSLKILEHGSFKECVMLKGIVIPNNISKIGYRAFQNCTSLEFVEFGKNVKTIGSEAFMNCSSLKSIILPNRLETLGSSAFLGCNFLSTVYLSNNLKEIEPTTFKDCVELQEIIFGDTIETIGSSSFFHCPKLTQLTIPISVNAIKDYAFSYTNLKELTVMWASPIQIENNVFDGINLSKSTLKVPIGTKDLYGSAIGWQDFGTIEEL